MKLKRSFSSYLLIMLVFFQMVSALPAGWSLVTNPSGTGIGIPLDLLQNTPFQDYMVPGLFLFFFLGLFPALIFYGMVKRPIFKVLEKLNLYNDYHWSWSFSYYLGVLLVLWINMQLYFIGEFSILHFVYSMLGILIILIAHLPSTKRDFKK